MDGAAACRNGRGVPGESDRVPERDGRARPVPPAVPGVRIAGAADPVREQRGELLRQVPDGRAAARRSVALAAPEAGLATLAGRAGRARRALTSLAWKPRSATSACFTSPPTTSTSS